MKKVRLKKTDINHLAKFAGFSSRPVRSIIATLFIGITLGIAYEEMVGVGTWHKFNPATEKFNVCFTPPSGCGSLVAQEIVKAKKSIYVQAYGLTSDAIIYQLKAARKRGVKVSVILDGGNLSDNDTVYLDLKKHGLNVYIDKMPGIAHNKVMIFDRNKVITGSFNFTSAADHKNAENIVLIQDKEIATIYLQNWQDRRNHSK